MFTLPATKNEFTLTKLTLPRAKCYSIQLELYDSIREFTISQQDAISLDTCFVQHHNFWTKSVHLEIDEEFPIPHFSCSLTMEFQIMNKHQ